MHIGSFRRRTGRLYRHNGTPFASGLSASGNLQMPSGTASVAVVRQGWRAAGPARGRRNQEPAQVGRGRRLDRHRKPSGIGRQHGVRRHIARTRVGSGARGRLRGAEDPGASAAQPHAHRHHQTPEVGGNRVGRCGLAVGEARPDAGQRRRVAAADADCWRAPRPGGARYSPPSRRDATARGRVPAPPKVLCDQRTDLVTQQRMASRLTETPRCNISSSTSRMLRVKRKYSHTTAWRIASGGKL